MLAYDRKDLAAAIQSLAEADRVWQRTDPTAMPSFELAVAYFETGSDADAAPRFERFVNAGTLRAGRPLDYVRSLYYLGRISERTGDRAKAADYYRRFLKYWSDGDLARDKVAEVKKKVGPAAG